MNELKDEIAYFMRRLYTQNLTTTSGGNISVRDGDQILITPSGLDKGRLTGEQIGVMDLNGNMLGDPFKPSIENQMHLAIYKTRPDITAIVHAHPVGASSFAASSKVLNTKLLAESYLILGNIAVAEYHCIGSRELADAVAAGVADGTNCLLMRNHGALALGNSLLEAFDRLEVMEACAKINLNLFGVLAETELELEPQKLQELDQLIGRK